MRHEDCPMAITLQEGTPIRGREAIAERPDGTRVNFVPYPTPILDSGGRVTGAVNVLVDITARKRAEEALREANNALVRIAGDLRIANAAKDEFLSLVSHELKTPLTTIRGNADVLHRRDGDIDPESRRVALADIVTEGDRLNRIIENLLLLARAEGGQGLQAEPILAIRVVKRVVDRHRSQYPWRTFEIVERGDPRPVIFSEACLEQVTENLISNAEKYSPSTEPIVIHFDRLEHELQMRVLDCGQGIEAKEAEHLFDPFYRSNDARGRATGLGIGLAVCKRLVETQGGRVWARGRPEGGSEFGFAIPISGEDGCESGVRTN
jgi:signal transduction histidine kinase